MITKSRPLIAALLFACAIPVIINAQTSESATEESASTATISTAIFAGGCFWCVESDFDNVPGVLATLSGYIGGTTEQPTYKNHTAAKHREAVEITYDPSVVSYEQLVEVFWRSIDPTDAGGQFCDRGHSYSSAIYAIDDNQVAIATASKAKLSASGALQKPIATSIEAVAPFWPAEGYHQDYYKKNPIRYNFYRTSCGRDKKVKSVWGDQAHAGIEKH